MNLNISGLEMLYGRRSSPGFGSPPVTYMKPSWTQNWAANVPVKSSEKISIYLYISLYISIYLYSGQESGKLTQRPLMKYY